MKSPKPSCVALFQRAPEIAPQRPGGYKLRKTSDETPSWYGSITRDIQLADEWDAINACRCALEDWLFDGVGNLHIIAAHGMVSVYAGSDRRLCPICCGPIIHIALITAANAVLDVRDRTK